MLGLTLTSCEKNEVLEVDCTEQADDMLASILKAYNIHYPNETLAYYVVMSNGVRTYNTSGIWRCFGADTKPTDCSNIY